MTLHSFLDNFLNGKLDGKDGRLDGCDLLADHGITQSHQFDDLCDILEDREGVHIHAAELSGEMTLNDLRVKISVYKAANEWKDRVRPNPITLPYAGLVGSFR